MVVGSTYFKVVEEAYATLAALMQDPARKPGAILFFIDSCCDTAANRYYSRNIERLKTQVLSPATGLTITSSGSSETALGLLNTGTSNAPNPYAHSFQDAGTNKNLSSINGGFYEWLYGIPEANQLFGQNLPNSNLGAAQVYGAFFPSKDIFKAKGGTCTFAVVDISPFDENHYKLNTQTDATQGTRNIGQAFIDAATAGGSCGGMASISASPTSQNVSLLAPTTPAPIVLTITNETLNQASNGNGSISGGTVSATLPNYLKFASAPTSTCTNGTSATPLTVAVTPGTAPAGDGFAISGIGIAFQQNCTITLPVMWSDTTYPSTNACIKSASNSAQLTITPGAALPANTFSTAQGQTTNQATSTVVCTSPELELTQTGFPTGPLAPGSTVSYTVTVSNLSETADANNAVLNDLVPAGVTSPNITVSGCTSTGDCTLPAKTAGGVVSSATFTVSFIVPDGQSQLNFQPNVELKTQGEVTLANNALSLSAAINKQVSIRAILNGGNGQFAAQNLPYSLTGCTATPAPSTTALNFDSNTSTTAHTAPANETCTLSLSAVPGPTPTAGGYTLLSATPVLNISKNATTGDDEIEAVWTAVPPTLATVAGSVAGAPSPFPVSLVGQTVPFALTCTPSAASPNTGTLTVDAQGALTTTDKPLVAAGSVCTLALTGDPSTLPLPSGYEWDTPAISSAGNNAFTVTLTMKPRPASTPTPVPSLQAWAVAALALLMTAAAGMHYRRQRQR